MKYDRLPVITSPGLHSPCFDLEIIGRLYVCAKNSIEPDATQSRFGSVSQGGPVEQVEPERPEQNVESGEKGEVPRGPGRSERSAESAPAGPSRERTEPTQDEGYQVPEEDHAMGEEDVEEPRQSEAEQDEAAEWFEDDEDQQEPSQSQPRPNTPPIVIDLIERDQPVPADLSTKLDEALTSTEEDRDCFFALSAVWHILRHLSPLVDALKLDLAKSASASSGVIAFAKWLCDARSGFPFGMPGQSFFSHPLFASGWPAADVTSRANRHQGHHPLHHQGAFCPFR
jgi:hypothetical protein